MLFLRGPAGIEQNDPEEYAGDPDNYIPETEFLANIDWVDANLRPFFMTLVDHIWVAEDVPIDGGYHELKFANTSDWTGGDWGNAIGLAGIAQLPTGGSVLDERANTVLDFCRRRDHIVSQQM